MIKAIGIIIVALVLGNQSFGDQITLKNGDRLSGALIKADGKSLIMKTEFAGEVSLPWTAVPREPFESCPCKIRGNI